ncbi:glycosidase [Microlunatus sp. GCM10028923]|uniref:glycoside hydrolase family 130 protein n=1 Tax=Microlunatus sp. GCM10028923 TaxID=3273400 RepID=UPI003605FF55
MTFEYRLERLGVIMNPLPGDPNEVEGVLNPGSGRGPDGELYLLPRLVATGNVSRVGLARVIIEDGVPTGVERQGVVLAPDRSWERGVGNAGTEDPRITWIEELGRHVMTYVAYGPLGPRTAVASSVDLRTWTRHGPVHYAYDDAVDLDLNLFPNKDTVFFPEPIIAPDGTESLAVLHRPMWELEDIRPGQGSRPPAWLDDPRQAIWISFLPIAEARRDLGALTRWSGHRYVAGPEFAFEELKIGGGPPPRRVPEGWLVLHHGVTGKIGNAFEPQQRVNYAAGAMILDAAEPWRVLRRTAEPLLAAETEAERTGTVPNVVFPTAIEDIDGVPHVFYGMADSRIGVARLVRDTTEPPSTDR